MLEDEMLTIEELANFLKLKPQTIYKWAQAGKIPGAKFGKEWRFRRSAIEQWINDNFPPRLRSPPPRSGEDSHSDGASSDVDAMTQSPRIEAPERGEGRAEGRGEGGNGETVSGSRKKRAKLKKGSGSGRRMGEKSGDKTGVKAGDGPGTN